MKNLWTTIHVRDMEESIRFYTEVLELEVVNRFKPSDNMEIAFLGPGETMFELIWDSSRPEVGYTDCVSTGFQVQSASEFMGRLKEIGVPIAAGPFQPSPHIEFFYICDPNGYRIQLVEQKTR